jgi:hypothetical protein
MKHKHLVTLFLFVIMLQIVIVPPSFAYREFINSQSNTYNSNQEIQIFTEYLDSLLSKHHDLLSSYGYNIDYTNVNKELNNIKNISQDNLIFNNLLNRITEFFPPITSNPFLGAMFGGLTGPFIGAALGGGIVLAIDAGISLIEIMVLAFSGAVLFGIIGAIIGFIPGFILLGLISAVLGAIFFGVVGAISGGIFGVMTLVFAIVAVPLLFIAGGLFGIVVGGIGAAIPNAVVGGPIGSLIGIIIAGALGAALGTVGGVAFATVQQLLFIPIVLLVAAIGAVLGFFIGIPAGALTSLFSPPIDQENAQENEQEEEQNNNSTVRPTPTRLGIPPNIDNLTPTTPVLPPTNYNPYTVSSKILTFLKISEKIIYNNDKDICTNLIGSINDLLVTYNKIFTNNSNNITEKISYILNRSNLKTVNGINKATSEILNLLPAQNSN